MLNSRGEGDLIPYARDRINKENGKELESLIGRGVCSWLLAGQDTSGLLEGEPSEHERHALPRITLTCKHHRFGVQTLCPTGAQGAVS